MHRWARPGRFSEDKKTLQSRKHHMPCFSPICRCYLPSANEFQNSDWGSVIPDLTGEGIVRVLLSNWHRWVVWASVFIMFLIVVQSRTTTLLMVILSPSNPFSWWKRWKQENWFLAIPTAPYTLMGDNKGHSRHGDNERAKKRALNRLFGILNERKVWRVDGEDGTFSISRSCGGTEVCEVLWFLREEDIVERSGISLDTHYSFSISRDD